MDKYIKNYIYNSDYVKKYMEEYYENILLDIENKIFDIAKNGGNIFNLLWTDKIFYDIKYMDTCKSYIIKKLKDAKYVVEDKENFINILW